MSLHLTQPCIADFAVLAHTMREDEIAQFLAFSGQEKYNPEVAAAGFIAAPGPKFALIDDAKRAVLAGGFVPVGRGVYEAWLAGPLESWQQHGKSIVRHCRRMIDLMLQSEAHRIQIIALATRTCAHEFYRRGLGMQCEGELRRYCADSQSAMMFSKVREV